MLPIQQIVQMMSSGVNPQQVMQQMLNNNPQAQVMVKQFQNMAGNMPPKDFAIQLLKQNGLSEKQIMEMAKKLNLK